jgi:hypothetical protein
VSVRVSGLLLGAALALTVTVASAQEDFKSANVVLPGCKIYIDLLEGRDPKLTMPIAIAAGYCAAVLDVLVSSSALDPAMCLNPNIENGQAIRVFVRYIEARPQRMHERFLVLAREALRDAWPCRK